MSNHHRAQLGQSAESNTSASQQANARGLARDIAAATLHRIDVWGVAFIVSIVAWFLHDAIRPSTLLLSFTIALLYWLGYAFNDYFDAPFDSQSDAKVRSNLFVRHPLSKRMALAGLLGAGGLVTLGFAQFGVKGLLMLGVAIGAMWAYSAPPLRLKSRPGLDLLAHALFVQAFPYFVCLTLVGDPWEQVDYVMLLTNFLASLSGQIAQQVRDYAVDSKTDVTFATTVGLGPAKICLRIVTAGLVLLVTFYLLQGTIPLVLAPLALLFAPVAISRLMGRQGPSSRRVVTLSSIAALVYAGSLIVASLVS